MIIDFLNKVLYNTINMKKVNLDDVRVEGSDYLLSLSKIAGKKVVDVTGYISREYDEPTFKISRLVLEDGRELMVEGEHDFPYVADDVGGDGVLEDLYNQDNDED